LPGAVNYSHKVLIFLEENKMSDQNQGENDDIPMMQKLLDNPFLLLFIGVASPAVLYLGWGIMEIVTIPAR
jgi:hypothetical protein